MCARMGLCVHMSSACCVRVLMYACIGACMDAYAHKSIACVYMYARMDTLAHMNMENTCGMRVCACASKCVQRKCS